jgi:hypothetical protein
MSISWSRNLQPFTETTRALPHSLVGVECWQSTECKWQHSLYLPASPKNSEVPWPISRCPPLPAPSSPEYQLRTKETPSSYPGYLIEATHVFPPSKYRSSAMCKILAFHKKFSLCEYLQGENNLLININFSHLRLAGAMLHPFRSIYNTAYRWITQHKGGSTA